MINSINLEEIKNISIDASKVIMKIYSEDFDVTFKDDKSPLTEADTQSNKIICEKLQKLYPHIPILSEENKLVPYETRKSWEYYWCIDPIDGTKEFIKKNDEFTINIALIHNDTPVLGIVYAPALNEMYTAKQGEGAFKNGHKLPLEKNDHMDEKIRVVASKSHLSEETQSFIDALPSKKVEQVSKGSSLKLCMVAEGSADIYPRLAPTMEWDTAAAHAVVLEAGKKVIQYKTKKDVIYNKQDLLNPWFIVK